MHVRLTKENILFDRQYGFQKNKTTSLAILDIYTKIVSSIENSDIACGIFLDFAKAFDTVTHYVTTKNGTLWCQGFTIVMVHLIPEQTP